MKFLIVRDDARDEPIIFKAPDGYENEVLARQKLEEELLSLYQSHHVTGFEVYELPKKGERFKVEVRAVVDKL